MQGGIVLLLMLVKVKKVVMGLDKFKRTPCGFCFVEYYARFDRHIHKYIDT